MTDIYLGEDIGTRRKVILPSDALRTHAHLIGATGAGKTTAIEAVMHRLMADSRDRSAVFVIDPMGGLAKSLMMWAAQPRYCPQHVRDRIVYIQPSRDDRIMPFNPLVHTSEANRYYQTLRAVDIILRAWSATDLAAQPRLLQWTYKALTAAAEMGFPISTCRFLLHPGTDEHDALVRRLPDSIRHHWTEILNARGAEATRILESTRNRLAPFFESSCLRLMFGSRQSKFDCESFIRSRRIVIINLAKHDSIPPFIANTIGGLFLNEILETASRLSSTEGREVVDPTYVCMDEFQRFVGVDVEDALPTVRQMGLRLILANQSFSQLERNDVDLTAMIWQARMRLIFKSSAIDADTLADELAKLTFDPWRVKHVETSTKQLIVGYRREVLRSWGESHAEGSNWNASQIVGYGSTHGISQSTDPERPGMLTSGTSENRSSANSRGGSSTESRTEGFSEANVPIHETFEEERKTFMTFEEWRLIWGRRIRRLATGEAFGMFPNGDTVDKMKIDHFPLRGTRRELDTYQELLDRNFASDLFISADAARREAEELRRELLNGPVIRIENLNSDEQTNPPADPFR